MLVQRADSVATPTLASLAHRRWATSYRNPSTNTVQVPTSLVARSGAPCNCGRPPTCFTDSCSRFVASSSHGRYPARIVVHKSSNFSAEEIDGLTRAARDLRIDTVDLVTVMDSKLRLFRDGLYPPYRGTRVEIDESRHILYTRGSVWYYQTYTGLYIPQPLELRIVRSEESPSFIAKEILGLTKMNWNNTQFDGKYPVTLGCARKVGEIMKYLEDGDTPQIRYGFYM